MYLIILTVFNILIFIFCSKHSKWFVNSTTGELKKRGSLIQPKKYCETLRLIAEHGGDILYNGTLADKLVEDIQEKGGIITKEDLLNYKYSHTIICYK